MKSARIVAPLNKSASLAIYFLVSVFMGLRVSDLQQAIGYAIAAESKSQDLISSVARASGSGLYMFVNILLESGVSPRWISIAINISLLLIFFYCLDLLYSSLGFSKINTLMLSLFSLSTYTFVNPIAYEIQVYGSITQGRTTPILILLTINMLIKKSSLKRCILLILICSITLWVHLVIGVFLAVFVILHSLAIEKVRAHILVIVSGTSIQILFF